MWSKTCRVLNPYEALAPKKPPHERIEFDCLLHMGIRTLNPFAKDMAKYHAVITVDEEYLAFTFTKAHNGMGKKTIDLRFDKFRHPDLEIGKTTTTLNETRATFQNYVTFRDWDGLARKVNYIMLTSRWENGPLTLSINGRSQSLKYMLEHYRNLALYFWEDDIANTVWQFLKEHLPQ